MNEADLRAQFQAYLRLIRQKVRDEGFVVQGVLPTKDGPAHVPFAYTIGLCDAGLPELIVSAPASPEMLHTVITAFVQHHLKDEIRPGERISYSDLGIETASLEIDQRFRAAVSLSAPVQQALNYAGTPDADLTGKVRVLQLLWPDEQGRFPGEPDYQDDGEQEVWP